MKKVEKALDKGGKKEYNDAEKEEEPSPFSPYCMRHVTVYTRVIPRLWSVVRVFGESSRHVFVL